MASVTDFVPILAERRARLAVRSGVPGRPVCGGGHSGGGLCRRLPAGPPDRRRPIRAGPTWRPCWRSPSGTLTRLRNDVERLHMRVSEWRAEPARTGASRQGGLSIEEMGRARSRRSGRWQLAAAGPGSSRVRRRPPQRQRRSRRCAPSGTSLALAASGHKFDQDCLAVTAGESFTIRFDNQDSDRHNVAILPSHTLPGEPSSRATSFPGRRATCTPWPRLVAGTYHFHCDIHPNLMNGIFIVAAAPQAAAPPSRRSRAPAQSRRSPPGPDCRRRRPKPAAPADGAVPRAGTRGPRAGRLRSRVVPAATDPAPHRPRRSSRLLLLLAGLALAVGGLSVAGGARRVGG